VKVRLKLAVEVERFGIVHKERGSIAERVLCEAVAAKPIQSSAPLIHRATFVGKAHTG
jgi:hypothetical protein